METVEIVAEQTLTVEGRSYEEGDAFEVTPNTALSLTRQDMDHRGSVARFPDADTETRARELSDISGDEMPDRRTQPFDAVDALAEVDGIGDQQASDALASVDASFESLDELLDADLTAMDGIGDATAGDIRDHYGDGE